MVNPYMAQKFDPYGQFMAQPFGMPPNSPFGVPPYQAFPQWPQAPGQFMGSPAYDFMGQGMSLPMTN